MYITKSVSWFLTNDTHGNHTQNVDIQYIKISPSKCQPVRSWIFLRSWPWSHLQRIWIWRFHPTSAPHGANVLMSDKWQLVVNHHDHDVLIRNKCALDFFRTNLFKMICTLDCGISEMLFWCDWDALLNNFGNYRALKENNIIDIHRLDFAKGVQQQEP